MWFTTYFNVSCGAESMSSCAGSSSPEGVDDAEGDDDAPSAASDAAAAAAASVFSFMRFAWASPVDWSPMTTHLSSARACFATSTSLGTLKPVMSDRKNRRWPLQSCEW